MAQITPDGATTSWVDAAAALNKAINSAELMSVSASDNAAALLGRFATFLNAQVPGASAATAADQLIVLRSGAFQRILANTAAMGALYSTALQALSDEDSAALLKALTDAGGDAVLVGRDGSGNVDYTPKVAAGAYSYAEVVTGADVPGKRLTLAALRDAQTPNTRSTLSGTVNLDFATDKLMQIVPVGASNGTINITGIPAALVGQTATLLFTRSGANTGVATLGSGFAAEDAWSPLANANLPTAAGDVPLEEDDGDTCEITVRLRATTPLGLLIGRPIETSAD